MRDLQLGRRTVLSGIAGVSSALAAAPSLAQESQAAAIHRRALVLDSHVDILLPSTNARYRGSDGQSFASVEKLKAGGVDALVYAVAVGSGERTPEGYAAARGEAHAKLAAIRALPQDTGGQIEIALTATDVTRIVASGKIAVLVGFQNAYSLGEDLAAFDAFHAGGVRIAALTHAGNNAFADSSRPRPGTGVEHGGLSPLGKAAVARFNDLGVLIDVSQLTPQGVLQTLELSKAPVAATHSDVRALVESPRNLSDAEIDAIAKGGGVIQVTPFNSYLIPKPAGYDADLRDLRTAYGLDPAIGGYTGSEQLPEDRRQAFLAAYDKLYPKAGVRTLADHIDYIAKRVGVDHVGFGSDFNHGAGIAGFADESQAPNLTAELLRRGYREGDIDKVWSGNFLRVLAAAQQIAA